MNREEINDSYPIIAGVVRWCQLAGLPGVADETKMRGYRPGAPDVVNRQLQAQDAAWRGAQGGILQIISTTTGEQLAAYKLDSFPRFDAMSVAEGRLFMSLENNTVSCYAEK